MNSNISFYQLIALVFVVYVAFGKDDLIECAYVWDYCFEIMI